jgi:hypothetical protein
MTGAGSWGALRVTLAVFIALMAGALAATLALNGGRLVFTLDDAYIHLALAENIARGHYGVSMGEFSAPSSSILWPFLIAPVARFAPAPALILLLNTLAAAGTLALAWKLLAPAGDATGTPGAEKLRALGLLLLIPAANLVALAYTGMEHSLQVFLAIAVVAGLAHEARTGRFPAWAVAALVAAPLVRYECLALSVPALVFLYARGHRALALAAAAIMASLLAAFSVFLVGLGLEAFPTSVLAKSGVVSTGGSLRRVAANLREGLHTPQGVLLALGALLLAARALSGPRGAARGLAAVVAAGAALHLLAGQYTGRYELYAWTAVVLTLLHLHKDALYVRVAGLSLWRTAALPILVAGVACASYLEATLCVPLDAANIYEQQYQMHRFAADYYRKPVAVNDLGYVSYRNDRDILDLWGLASLEALKLRREHPGGDTVWMARLPRAKGVRLAMIYDAWFAGVPDSWGRVGDLRLGPKAFSTSRSFVSFYALDCPTFREASLLARDFGATLPNGAVFDTSRALPPAGCAPEYREDGGDPPYPTTSR